MTMLSQISGYTIKPANLIDNKCISMIVNSLSVGNVEKIILDMSYVSECSHHFLRLLREYKNRIILVNTDSKILSLIYITGYDKYVKIFEDEVSLSENKNELINRRFYLV